MKTWGRTAALAFAVTGLVACGSEGPEPVALEGHSLCSDHVKVMVKSDEWMLEIAGGLTGDKRLKKLFTQTKTQAYDDFRNIFKDRPELLSKAEPDSLPASVTVVAADGVDTKKLAEELRAQFPQAKSVEPIVRADVIKMKNATDVSECPPSGEWPVQSSR